MAYTRSRRQPRHEMMSTQQQLTAYPDNLIHNGIDLSTPPGDRLGYNTGAFTLAQSPYIPFPTQSQYSNLSSPDYAGGGYYDVTVQPPWRWEDSNTETTSRRSRRGRRNDYILNGVQTNTTSMHPGLPSAKYRPSTIGGSKYNRFNGFGRFAEPSNILTEGANPAFFSAPTQIDPIPTYRYPPHQYYGGGQVYSPSPPMWEPVALPSEVTGLRGYGVSSPGYPGTYHPGVSMGWSWQSNSTPISPDLRGISGQFSPRPAYAEPAYVEYAAGSHSTNAATTTGAATSQGSTSEGSVIVFDMNTSKVEPIPRPKWRFPEQEVFPLNNGAPVIQMMNHDPKPQPCKGHGFRHWLHTHFRHHGCPSDPLKDVVITLPKKM